MKQLIYLNKYLYKYRLRFVLGILFVGFSNFFAIYPAQIVREAFDIIIAQVSNQSTFAINEPGYFFARLLQYFVPEITLPWLLLLLASLILLLALLKGLFMFFMRQTIIVMSRFIEYDLKNEIYDHYQKLGPIFYKRNNTGDLMNRISEDVSRVRMYLGPAIMYTINLVALFTLVITTMVNVNPKLTLYVLLPLPVLSITIYYVSHLINKKSEIVQQQLSVLSTFSQEAFSGIRVLKAYSRENYSYGDFEKECDVYKSKNLQLVKINALFHPFMILLIGLSTLLTVLIGGREAIAGNITTGNIAEFIIYVNMLTWPVASLGWVTSLVQRASASMRRITEFLDQDPEILSGNGRLSNPQGKIVFDDVSFTYIDSGIEALSHISFKVEPGTSLAIVGRTGSGKSTIAHLITRLYDVESGFILIDDCPITTLNTDDLRNTIGYIPQDVFLFSDSIANNISFSKTNVPKTILKEAARKAAVLDNVMEFRNGLDTIVGERGITLSGGQKQRIAIARALIKDPSIIIFDDALSAVDTETENEILINLENATTHGTKIIISHRISSIKKADQIIVLDKGKIVEKGSHQSLIKNKASYYEMYKQQLLENQNSPTEN